MEDRQSLARQCVELKEKHAELKAQAADIWKEFEATSFKLIEAMESESIQKFVDSDLNKDFKIDIGLSFKVIDPEAFADWVESSGNGDCVKRSVHASTRDAIVKVFMEQTGQDVPGIQSTPYKVIAMRAVKTKGVANV